MRKIGLKLDTLAVESFVTAPAPAAGGTVRAHDDALTPLCSGACPSVYSCNVAKTLYESCVVNCDCTNPGSPC